MTNKKANIDSTELVSSYIKKEDWRVNENSNAGYSYASLLNHLSGSVVAKYTLDNVYTEKIAKAHANGDIHIHDLSSGIIGYCFTEDTKVRLIDETTPTFKELTERYPNPEDTFWVFSYDINKNCVVMAKAQNPRITRQEKNIIEITVKGDKKNSKSSVIKCSLDHKFLMRNKEYIEASKLKIGDSIMPLTNAFNPQIENQFSLKVTDINYISYKEPINLYDLTVPTYHNFALEANVFVHNCAGWSLRNLLMEGFKGCEGRASAGPAKHFDTALGQIVNFMCTLQTEWAGAQAFSSFDTFLAPFVRGDNLSYKEVKQSIQQFVFGLNIASRWGQCVPVSYKALCADGTWKYQHELKVGDSIIVYDYKKRAYKTDKLTKVSDYQSNGKMHKYSEAGKKFSFLVSDKHRVIYKQGTSPEKILPSNELLALRKTIGIPTNCEGIQDNFINLNLNDINQILAPIYRNQCLNSLMPKEILSLDRPASIHAMKFMGYRTSNNDPIYVKCANTDVQEQVLSLGIRAGYSVYKHKIGNELVVMVHPASHRMCDITEVAYDGKMWCPTTETGTFVCMTDEGYVFMTGNTPFTNLTFDWVVPNDLKGSPVIIAGQLQEGKYYKDYQPEMDMINKAFIEVMMAGDKDGRIFSFPIPTYNITKDFNWTSENARLLFMLTGKYGTPYFQNFINSDLHPEDIRSMCCRLSLNIKELRKKGNGLFGAGESTGSLGVVTLNMPRIGYLSKTKEEYFAKLKELMDIAKDSLEVKRKEVQANLDRGLMPYTKIYLGTLKNHFNTIGLVGMNESCLNFLGCSIFDEEGKEFAESVLDFMRNVISDYQEETGNMYNLEASPAEGTSYRLAKIDKKLYPSIISMGENEPYYTNSTQLPVNFTDDLFEALDIQESLQSKYTGGTVFHCFLGENIHDPNQTAGLIKKLCETYKIPYFTITPSFSICPVHGYIPGEHEHCPYDK